MYRLGEARDRVPEDTLTEVDMSGRQPATPQRREIEIMRVLFDRHLKERAIALADSRWPGSGRMVDLAYEWGQLPPAERRERLSAIGPEEIARLREFSALNPELAAAIDELDRRGVLPHLEAAAVEATSAAQAAYITQPQADPESPPADPVASPPSAPAQAEAETLTAIPARPEVEFGFEDPGIDAIEVDMPDLDLGLPSTSEFMREREDQRLQSIAAAEATMDRVRQRLDQSTQRALQRGAAVSSPKFPETPRIPAARALPDARSAAEPPRSMRAIEPPEALSTLLRAHAVTSLGSSERRPTDDELVALANELQIGYAEFALAPGRRRELYGGLTTTSGRISVEAGPLPCAIAEPNLVVIRGRLSPQAIRRIEEGFFDIPGTRASVRVHPDARVLLLPN
jgi:hypothetical protein